MFRTIFIQYLFFSCDVYSFMDQVFFGTILQSHVESCNFFWGGGGGFTCNITLLLYNGELLIM